MITDHSPLGQIVINPSQTIVLHTDTFTQLPTFTPGCTQNKFLSGFRNQHSLIFSGDNVFCHRNHLLLFRRQRIFQQPPTGGNKYNHGCSHRKPSHSSRPTTGFHLPGKIPIFSLHIQLITHGQPKPSFQVPPTFLVQILVTGFCQPFLHPDFLQ